MLVRFEDFHLLKKDTEESQKPTTESMEHQDHKEIGSRHPL
jgi:hypothetical protein